MRPFRFLTLLALTVACGDATGPGRPSMAGTWVYSVSNLGTSLTPAVLCNISGMTMTFTQDGANFTGMARGGAIQCNSGSPSKLPDSAAVSNGFIDGNAISFDVGGNNHFGAHNGTAVVGMAVYPMNQFLTLNGRFVLTRK